MAQSFDFENFVTRHDRAASGLDTVITRLKELPGVVTDIVRDLGSARFAETAESFNEQCEEMLKVFQSVIDLGEDVKLRYKQTNEAFNG